MLSFALWYLGLSLVWTAVWIAIAYWLTGRYSALDGEDPNKHIDTACLLALLPWMWPLFVLDALADSFDD